MSTIKLTNELPENLESLSPGELIKYIKQYHKYWKFNRSCVKVYESLLTDITNLPIDDIRTVNKKTMEVTIHKEKVVVKPTSEYKIQALIDELKEQNKHLTQTNISLQIDNKNKQEDLIETVNRLQKELADIKSTDPISQQRRIMENMAVGRRDFFNRPVIEGYIELDRIFPDKRKETAVIQLNVEQDFLSQYIHGLKSIAEIMPYDATKLSQESLLTDINIIIKAINESKRRLSFVASDEEYVNFITEYNNQLVDILDVLGSKTSEFTPIPFKPTPYEQGLLWYAFVDTSTGYLKTHDDLFDVQKRFLTTHMLQKQIKPFTAPLRCSYNHLFCQIEDVIKSLFISTVPINNIIYKKDHNNPWTYYTLKSVAFNLDKTIRKCVWELDTHCMETIRLFLSYYIPILVQTFKRFYKDVFDDNKYRENFWVILEERNISSWSLFKILYENIQICGDEDLFGYIFRSVIRKNAERFPDPSIDIFNQTKFPQTSVISDIKSKEVRLSSGLPSNEEEPETYMFDCFDNYSDWDRKISAKRYINRWKTFISKNCV